MNLQWVRPLLIRSKHWVAKNAPHLLMGLGTGGSITAVILAVKATPAAVQAKKDAEFEKTAGELPENGSAVGIFTSDMEKLTPWETIKVCGKYYIAPVGIELFSLMCFWGAHGIDVRRQAVLAGLYSTAEQALIEYQKKVVEMIGEKPEKEIRNAIAQDKVDRNPPPPMVLPANDMELWCLIDQQYFRSSYYKIKQAENQANHEMIQHMYLSQSELYWLLDPDGKWLKPDRNSGLIGWSVDKLLVLEADYARGPDDNPILMIGYKDGNGLDYAPQAGFSAMY